MKQYKNEIDNLHWTKEGKENLIRRIETNRQQSRTSNHGFFIRKCALLAITISVVSVTAYATGMLQSASDILGPILGASPIQTEIIEKTGRPVGASDTSEGITITVDAIIGDSSNVCVVYSIGNEDGTPFIVPEGVDPQDVFFASVDSGTEFSALMGGLHGSTGVVDIHKDDGTLQVIEKISTTKKLPLGKNVTAKFSELSYFSKEGQVVKISDGEWDIRYKLDFEDTGIHIPVGKSYEKADTTYTVDDISISPIAITAKYTVEGVPDWGDGESGQMSEQQIKETDKFLDSVTLIITKKDGTIVDLTEYSGGSVFPHEDDTICQKGTVLDEIISLDEIATITVGDISVEMNG